MNALLTVLLALVAPVEIPQGHPLPPWPAWACESYQNATVCTFNPEGFQWAP